MDFDSGSRKVELYPFWELEIPAISERSVFPPLSARGLGTPEAESFTSYLYRLTRLQCVAPQTLLNYLIEKKYGPDVRYTNNAGQLAKLLNGLGWATEEIISLFHENSISFPIECTTLLPLRDILSNAHLIRNTRVWCVQCLAEQENGDDSRYEKLAWSLAAVEVCLKHNLPLVNLCLSCNSFVYGRQLAYGRCRFCEKLVESTALAREVFKRRTDGEEVTERKLWIDQEVGNIIAFLPMVRGLFNRQKLQRGIELMIQDRNSGNLSKFCLERRIREIDLVDILEGKSKISLIQLLNVCFPDKVSPVDLLSGKIEEEIIRKDFSNLGNPKPINWRSRIREPIPIDSDKLDTERLKEAEIYLNEALTEDPPPSLQNICGRLDISRHLLMKNYPQICHRVKLQHQNFVDKKMRKRWESDYS